MGQNQSNQQTSNINNEINKTTVDNINKITNTPPSSPLLNNDFSTKLNSNKLKEKLERQIETIDKSYRNKKHNASIIIQSVYKSYLIRKEIKNWGMVIRRKGCTYIV